MIVLYDSVLLISSFLFSFLATWGAYVLLKHYGVLDQPVERSNHAEPTPRGGGIGIVFALVCFLQVAGAPGPVILSLLALAVISFIDDVRGVQPKWRLLAQVVVVFWVLLTAYQGRIFTEWLPFALEIPLVALALIWFINLFNFMDGADGLAAGEAGSIGLGAVAVAMSVTLPVDVMLYGMLVFGAVLGFALWNWHPAKVFMGDTGSIPLGFLLGFVLLFIAGEGYWQAALILPAYFVADASFTLIARLVRREKILQAHSGHFYQRAIRGGMAHDAVARSVIGLNLVLIVLAVLSTFGSYWGLASLVAAYFLAAMLMLWFGGKGRGGNTQLQPSEGQG